MAASTRGGLGDGEGRSGSDAVMREGEHVLDSLVIGSTVAGRTKGGTYSGNGKVRGWGALSAVKFADGEGRSYSSMSPFVELLLSADWFNSEDPKVLCYIHNAFLVSVVPALGYDSVSTLTFPIDTGVGWLEGGGWERASTAVAGIPCYPTRVVEFMQFDRRSASVKY